MTDLQAAFETISHLHLTMKLEHYGIRGDELKLISSFLYNRCQFVQIGQNQSIIRKTGDVSTLQGSKLSCLFFNLMLNEINILHTLMSTDMFTKITGKIKVIYTNIKHFTISIMDDSSHLIEGSNTDNIKFYLYDFYTLLESFYEINQLKI